MKELEFTVHEWERAIDGDYLTCHVTPNIRSILLYRTVTTNSDVPQERLAALIETGKESFRRILIELRAELNAMEMGDI